MVQLRRVMETSELCPVTKHSQGALLLGQIEAPGQPRLEEGGGAVQLGHC